MRPHLDRERDGKFSQLYVATGLSGGGADFFRPFAHALNLSRDTNAHREVTIAQHGLDAGICDHPCELWDVAATDAILRAAGGRMLPLNDAATAIAGPAIEYRADLLRKDPFAVPPHISVHPDLAAELLRTLPPERSRRPMLI